MLNSWFSLNFKGESLLPVGVIRDEFMGSSDLNWVFKGKILIGGNGQDKGTSGERGEWG